MRRLAYIAIWLFVFTVPWENTVVLDTVGTISKAIGIAAAAIGVLLTLIEGRLRVPAWLRIGLLFVFWAWMSSAWTIDMELTIAIAFTYTQLWLMAWLIYQYSRDGADLFHAYTLGACVAVANTLHAYSQGLEVSYLRFAAKGFDPNDLSIYLSIAIPMAVYLYVRTTSLLLRAVYVSYVPVATLAVLLTGSRTGGVALVIALLTALVCSRAMSWRWWAVMIFIVTIGGIVIASVVPWESVARISTLVTELQQGTWNFRLMIWEAGIGVLEEHSVLGVGAGAFRTAVNPLLLREATPHNVFLSIAVEGGMPALIMWVSLLLLSLRRLSRLSNVERWTWLGVLLILVTAFLSLNFEWRKVTWLVLALATKAGGHRSVWRDQVA